MDASVEYDREDAAWLLDPARRAALVVAHPAHELRVLQWLSQTRARAYILTQGSRSGSDATRRRVSEQIIEAAGGSVAPWGAVWDRDLYKFLLAGDGAPFQTWTRELSADFVRGEVDLVVADAWQYYNVAHDLTHLMARIAALRAGEVLGREIFVADYPVVPDALAQDAPHSSVAAILNLNAEAAAAKTKAVASIADVAGEAAELEEVEGEKCYAREILRRPPPLGALLSAPPQKPLYERFGEERVKSNIYFDVIRWSHVARICEALTAEDVEAEALAQAQV